MWYSQEARAYGLFVFMAALAMWCWLRADADPTPGRLGAFAASGAAALATHYFAVFLLAPMCLWLLRPRRIAQVAVPGVPSTDPRSMSPGIARPAGPRSAPPRGAFTAVAAIVLVGAALLPLALAQGGHGTQWIGAWALASRLEAIPQYYLTGYSGAPLGHGLELLVALEILAAVGYGLWRMLHPARERIGAAGAGGGGVRGADPGGDGFRRCRLPGAAQRGGGDDSPDGGDLPTIAGGAAYRPHGARVGGADRGDVRGAQRRRGPQPAPATWRLARACAGDRVGQPGERPPSRSPRAITTVELGAAPLEYYLPPLHNLRRGAVVRVSEIDETGYAPLRSDAGDPPAPGFHLVQTPRISTA